MFGYGRLAASEGIYYRVVCCWKGERGVAFHHVAIILDMLALRCAMRSQEPNILNTMEKIPFCAVSKVGSGQKTAGGRFSLLLSLAQEGIPGLIIPRGTYVRRYLL
ncbi:hypothetical protein I312_100971 [Cryptococcus bacillisporus CA1280]|uniref:uncharacterized protein n=1 Tax=Cryptococcus bacillisporus CA1280 TaxID=1296109 RepID=UPI0033662C5B